MTTNDVASGAAVAILLVSVIAAVALIIAGAGDIARYLTAPKTWIAFGKFVASLLGIFVAIVIAALVATYMPWPIIGSTLAALLAIIVMPFATVFGWFASIPSWAAVIIVLLVLIYLKLK